MPMDRRTFIKGTTALGAGVVAANATAGNLIVKSDDLYPDRLFTKPFIDIDVWRDEPVRHRYVHGGFADTDLRFSMYFPPVERYQGRFLHPLMHIAGQENVAPNGRLAGMDGNSIAFAAASGAYLVESNMGSFKMLGPSDITGFRASAATAQYGRILAAKMYGAHHRPYGYVYGGSGGSYKTFTCVENTTGVWDGAVPFIHPCPIALPNVHTAQAHAFRILDGKFDQIVDAIEPGGSGDMYAGLNEEQRASLKEITRMGFPPRAWWAHDEIAFAATGVYGSIIGTLFKEDPTYFQDFWTKPGYLGANPPKSLRDARIQFETTIVGKITTADAKKRGLPVSISAGTRDTAPAGLRLAKVPNGRLQGAFLYPQSGPAKDQRLVIIGMLDDLIMLGFDGENIPALEAMKSGDPVRIDNSENLASQTFYRHQNPPPEYYAWDQFRDPDGKPFYPQRPLIKGYNQAGEGNAWQSGRFDCKMITVNCLMDEGAWPWMPDWYRHRVIENYGPAYTDRYRLWYLDHAMHVNPSRYLSLNEGDVPMDQHGPADTHIVSYAGVLQQALRDVAAWAEKGIAPPAETKYHVEDSQIVVPRRAKDRRGIQPTVDLTANRGERADVKVGEKVELVALIESPPGSGSIVSAEWDYDGQGAYLDLESYSDGADVRTVRRAHSYDKPGTYFIAVRATSQRKDAIDTPFARIVNLGRARVVVT